MTAEERTAHQYSAAKSQHAEIPHNVFDQLHDLGSLPRTDDDLSHQDVVWQLKLSPETPCGVEDDRLQTRILAHLSSKDIGWA